MANVRVGFASEPRYAGGWGGDQRAGNRLPQVRLVTGGAGNFTVTGIATADAPDLVLHLPDAGGGRHCRPDREFSITAANTINNTGGTASTNGKAAGRLPGSRLAGEHLVWLLTDGRPAAGRDEYLFPAKVVLSRLHLDARLATAMARALFSSLTDDGLADDDEDADRYDDLSLDVGTDEADAADLEADEPVGVGRDGALHGIARRMTKRDLIDAIRSVNDSE